MRRAILSGINTPARGVQAAAETLAKIQGAVRIEHLPERRQLVGGCRTCTFGMSVLYLGLCGPCSCHAAGNPQ